MMALINRKEEIINGNGENINSITIEIKELYQYAMELELSYAVKIGRKLKEAKEILKHGEWGGWVRDNLPFSQRKADMMMQIYENYGTSQDEISGVVKSETFENLGASKAYALLSVPEKVREEFVKNNRVYEMSVRELRKEINKRYGEKTEAEEIAKTASETEMQERDRRITELEKKLAMSSPEIAAFKTHFTQLQETQRKIEESLAKIRTADAATAEKLLAAIAAAEKAFAERVGVKT